VVFQPKQTDMGIQITNASSLNEISDGVHDLARSKGWHDDKYDDDVYFNVNANNFHDEISEMHEAWRKHQLWELCDKAEKMATMGLKPLTNIEEEMADLIIRVCDCCRRLKVDIATAVTTKHQFNATREYRHGNKKG
jgi:NTP pyrophosphatase (non-canonical NTP hydrolase)